MYKTYLKHKFKRLNPRVARKKDLVMIKTKTRKHRNKKISKENHISYILLFRLTIILMKQQIQFSSETQITTRRT